MAPPEVLGILGERLHRGVLGLDPHLQYQHVLELCAAMLTDIPEGQVADVHAMNDQRSGNSQAANISFSRGSTPSAFACFCKPSSVQRILS
jgi:hypothetical protein